MSNAKHQAAYRARQVCAAQRAITALEEIAVTLQGSTDSVAARAHRAALRGLGRE